MRKFYRATYRDTKMAKKKAMSKDEEAASPSEHPDYELRISRLTIDKLGVKLYDKVSAVVAELIANSYDADAEVVRVKLPLNTLLTVQSGGVTEP
jgi:hypothetical protein